jgi:hypothetical protein
MASLPRDKTRLAKFNKLWQIAHTTATQLVQEFQKLN